MDKDKGQIGFIQGRLSPITNNRVQFFPWDHWTQEFSLAHKVGLSLIEWTIDSHRFIENPLLTSTGREQILNLIQEFQVHVPSVTCDYYMENPHWKANPVEVSKSLRSVLHGMSLIGSRVLVIPLVDNSSIRETHDFDWQYFLGFEETLIETQTQIAFEVDLPPNDAAAFMSNFNPELFGINYDIGNSASLGYDPREEIDLFGDRIFNVHVKDRLLGAQTVPLGQGNANFRQVFDALKSVDYRRNYILQTARSSDGKHFDVLLEYKIFLESILSK